MSENSESKPGASVDAVMESLDTRKLEAVFDVLVNNATHAIRRSNSGNFRTGARFRVVEQVGFHGLGLALVRDHFFLSVLHRIRTAITGLSQRVLSRGSSSMMAGREIQDSKPPASAQYLLELLASPDWSEAAAGDFFEKYERKFHRVRTKHSVFLAKVDYWWQVLHSTPGLLRIRLRDLAALGGIAKLFDVLQKYWAAK